MNLLDQIRTAQIRASEAVVMRHLGAAGLGDNNTQPCTALEDGSVVAMDSTMGELQYQTRSAQTHADERAVVWRRRPYANRPELVTAAEAMALDEAAGRTAVVSVGIDVQADAQEMHIPPDIATDFLVYACHGASMRAGWWINPRTGVDARDNPMCFSQKLMLTVSELAESMEGDRKGLQDDKLPQYPMRIVELADAAIRIFDLAGAYIKPEDGFTFGEVLAAKLAFNAVRPDHKAEARAAAGGKAY